MVEKYLIQPKFSIIIPCYNDGALAIEAIHSCLTQCGGVQLEVLLVDDGSSDGSAEMLTLAYRTEDRIRILRKKNGGLASARNYGLERARGDWHIFLDSDDMLSPFFLQKATDVIDSTGGAVDLVILPFRYVSARGWRDSRLLLSCMLLAPRFTKWRAWNRFWIRVGNTLPVSSLVISRSMASRLGGFNQSLKAHEDWEYWIRAIDHGARIRYARMCARATTLISLRQGMSADRSLMAETHSQVRRMHCTHSPFRWLNLRPVLLFLLIVRTILGLMQACVGRRVNLTCP